MFFPVRDLSRSNSCEPGWLKCPKEPLCVHESWICDGDEDCGDGSDEPPTCRW